MPPEATTATRFLPTVLTLLLGVALALPAARADIYTWTDENGRVNISNLTPPEGAHVTSVLRETPKPPMPIPLAIPATPQQDVQVLSDRVRQLELEVELARRQAAPPTIIYATAPAPQPQVQYVYAPEPAPAPSYGYAYAGYGYPCDPSWFGCGLGYGFAPYWYPASVVVVTTPAFHRHDYGHGRRPVAAPAQRNPMTAPLPVRGPGPGRSPGPGLRPPGGVRGPSFARR